MIMLELYTKDLKNIEVVDIDMEDYSVFRDAYIESAQHADGTPLNDRELDLLNTDLSFVNLIATKYIKEIK